MLQLEYDKENDRSIDSMEKRYNGESKGMYMIVRKVSCMFLPLGIRFLYLFCDSEKKK